MRTYPLSAKELEASGSPHPEVFLIGEILMFQQKPVINSAMIAAATVGLNLSSSEASGALQLAGVPDSSYVSYAQRFEGRVGFLQYNRPGQPVGYASVTFITPWCAITSGHVVHSLLNNGTTFQVGNGNNYSTNRGTVSDVSNIILYPGYNGTRSGPDIAMLHFATPIPGVVDAVLGSVGPGEVVGAAGYGFAGPAGQTIPPRDGNRRGWDGKVDSLPPIDSSPIYYQSTIFSAYIGVPLCGKGLNGDSGGGVFDMSTGELVALVTAQTGGGSTTGTQINLKLSQPEVSSWIENNKIVPAPGAISLLGLAGISFGPRRRRGS